MAHMDQIGSDRSISLLIAEIAGLTLVSEVFDAFPSRRSVALIFCKFDSLGFAFGECKQT